MGINQILVSVKVGRVFNINSLLEGDKLCLFPTPPTLSAQPTPFQQPRGHPALLLAKEGGDWVLCLTLFTCRSKPLLVTVADAPWAEQRHLFSAGFLLRSTSPQFCALA